MLGWITAGILPPRYKQFRDAQSVVEAIRANAPENDIYTAPQGLFVAVSLQSDLSNRLKNPALRFAGQLVVELAVALGLSVLLLGTSIRSPLRAGGFLGLVGLVAGTEVRFPEWNWAGFPTIHMLSSIGYLAANWFIAGLVLGALRLRIDVTGRSPGGERH